MKHFRAQAHTFIKAFIGLSLDGVITLVAV